MSININIITSSERILSVNGFSFTCEVETRHSHIEMKIKRKGDTLARLAIRYECLLYDYIELPYPAFLGKTQLRICFQPSFVLKRRTRKVPTIP